MTKNFFNDNNLDFLEDVSLKKYNTYRINTICKYLVFPKNEEQLIAVIEYAKQNIIKYLVLGNGSNVIFSMDYYDGIIIKLDSFNHVEFNGTQVMAEAGYSLIKLSMETIEKGLSGFEFSTGIPGSIGGSVAMNAGAYNSDISAILKEARVLTPNNTIVTMNKKDFEYAYRDSFIKRNPGYYVLSATFELTNGDIEYMKLLVQERQSKRTASQPLDFPSAGSVFRNPEGNHAGALIEQVNLKGLNINGAEVSTKHANFIINKENATGKDIIKLINIIKKEVKDKYNIELKLEQIIVE